MWKMGWGKATPASVSSYLISAPTLLECPSKDKMGQGLIANRLRIGFGRFHFSMCKWGLAPDSQRVWCRGTNRRSHCT